MEGILYDIRHTKLQLQESKQKLKAEIETLFNGLAKRLENRKRSILQDLDKEYQEEMKKVDEETERWVLKKEKAVELVNYMKNEEQNSFLTNTNKIYQILDLMNEPLIYKEVEVWSGINTRLRINRPSKEPIDLTSSELGDHLDTYVTSNDRNSIKYKC